MVRMTIRRLVLVLGMGALALAFVPALSTTSGVASAQTPPDTLNGETLSAGTPAFPNTAFEMDSISCFTQPPPFGTSSYHFSASGTATGPITGTFTESGTVSWSGTGSSHATLNITFTINDTPTHVAATGTKYALAGSGLGFANGGCEGQGHANLTGNAGYSATFADGSTETSQTLINMSNYNLQNQNPNPGYSMVEKFGGGGGGGNGPSTINGTVLGTTGAPLPAWMNPGVAACQANMTPPSGCSVTNADASGNFTINLQPGQYNVAGFVMVNGATISSPSVSITIASGQTATVHLVVPIGAPTSLVYTGPNQGDLGDPLTVSAKLLDSSGNPLVGQQVSFSLNMSNCSAPTDPTGTATCVVTPPGPVGPGNFFVNFQGTPAWAPASIGVPFTTTPEQTVVSYTGATLVANGTTTQLQGQLFTDDGVPVVGRSVLLSLGSQSCTGTTDVNGNAVCSITVSQSVGYVSFSASFAGDSFYLGSMSSPVSGFLFAGSSFVIGNGNAVGGNAVTFWGAQWASLNSTSGGAAPSSFKGYADTSTPGLSCGTTWVTSPGNSSSPPARVPAYIGVIVTSSVSKSGSAISGNTVGLAIIQTNPGYANDPGHAGTGTVVAVIPCT